MAVRWLIDSFETIPVRLGAFDWTANDAAPVSQTKDLAGAWAPSIGAQGNILHDLSGFGHIGSLVNIDAATAWAPTVRVGVGVFGFTLDGTTSYVDFTDTTLFDFPDTTFTVSFWVNTVFSAAGNKHLLNKRDTAGGTLSSGWATRMNAVGTITARIFDDVGTVAAERISVGSVNDGVWHLVTVIFTTDTVTSANNSLSVYIDGVLNQGSLSQSGAVYLPSPVALKFGVQADLTALTYWTGSIDDIRIYSRALTDQEVWETYADPYALYRPRTRVLALNVATADPGLFLFAEV